MLIIQGDDSNSSPEQMQAQLLKYQTWMLKWKEQNKYVNGSPFLPEGRLLISPTEVRDSGDFLDPLNIIGGYIWIKAESIDKATEIAAECPLLDNLEILIRPFMKIKMMDS